MVNLLFVRNKIAIRAIMIPIMGDGLEFRGGGNCCCQVKRFLSKQ